jgi:thioredoxin-like negative regulator of GroEL
MSIPTLAVFKGGKIVEETIGAAPKEQIEQMFKKYIE